MSKAQEIPSWEDHIKARDEAIKRGDKPIEVNCLGTKKFELLGKVTYRRIRIFSESQGRWTEQDCVEFEDACPVCLKLMVVRAIQGSTYLACCSSDCYKKYDLWRNETFKTQPYIGKKK